MRLSLLSLAVFGTVLHESATAFVISLTLYKMSRIQVMEPLRYQIVYPDDHEEANAKEKKQRQDATAQAAAKPPVSAVDGAVATFEGYIDYDELQEATDMLNVDTYDRLAGGIIPGQQLSSLCSDD